MEGAAEKETYRGAMFLKLIENLEANKLQGEIVCEDS